MWSSEAALQADEKEEAAAPSSSEALKAAWSVSGGDDYFSFTQETVGCAEEVK